MRHRYRRRKMKPYCGWRRANESGVRTCRTLGPCSSWHRFQGIARHELTITRKAVKVAERQRAKKEIKTDMNDASSFEQLRKSATLLCQSIAEVLRTKGLKAYVGYSWDGSHEYNDPEYWYLYPRDNGGVGLYCEYNHSNNGGTYDAGHLDAKTVELALSKLTKLDSFPNRQEIWTCLEETKE